MKLFNARVHGVIDYLVVALFALAPTLFQFGGTPQTLCYVLAMVHLTMSALTAYPLGAIKLIPFPVHGSIEAVVALALVAMPWLFGFSEVEHARNFFLIAGGLVAVVVVTTNYKGSEAIQGRRTVAKPQ